jgi:signal peptidase I
MQKNDAFIPYRVIIAAFVLFLIILGVGIEIRQVDGHSMEPTILPGSFVLINKLEYGIIIPIIEQYLIRWKSPARGEIVATRHPHAQKVLIKRCLADSGAAVFYGDTYLIVNSRVIPGGNDFAAIYRGEVKVPDDKSLIIGDNYPDSLDSRAFGFIDNTNILGRVILL